MSGNYFPTGQTPYSVNLPFGFASNGSTNHTAAVGMPWNVNFNCINNQAAGYWPNYQFQPPQPPLPLFPPPQQPPPPSFPPQENWSNGYSNQQQGSFSGLATFQSGNHVMPYYFSQYPPQNTANPAFSSFSQSGFHVGDHNVGSKKVKAQQGAITHMPKISWNILSTSLAASTGDNNRKKEDLINNGGVESSTVETIACKMSTSKVETAPIKLANSNGGCDENGYMSKDCPNPKPHLKGIMAGQVGLNVCAYCKISGHRTRRCPIKPCYICGKTGHKPKSCPEYWKKIGNTPVASNNTAPSVYADWGALTSQSSIPPCVTGANAIPRGNGRPMSINKPSAPSSSLSAAPIVDDGSLGILVNEFPRSSGSKQESAQDDSSSAPSRKRQRACDSNLIEKDDNDEFVPLDSSIKGLPREELERIIMAYDGMMADMEQELNHSKERAETLEREVISLRVKSESRSVGVQVDELPKDVTPDHQNNSQTPAVKIERIEGTSVSSRNMFTNTTNKGRPKGISRSPSTIVSTAHIFDVLTAICNKNEVAVKTEKL